MSDGVNRRRQNLGTVLKQNSYLHVFNIIHARHQPHTHVDPLRRKYGSRKLLCCCRRNIFSHRAPGVAWMSGMSFIVSSKCPTKLTPNIRSRPSAVRGGPLLIPSPAIGTQRGFQGRGQTERDRKRERQRDPCFTDVSYTSSTV